MKEHDATELAYLNGYKQGAVDAVRKMQELLCEGRVSNDPVVIAVNVAAKQLLEENT